MCFKKLTYNTIPTPIFKSEKGQNSSIHLLRVSNWFESGLIDDKDRTKRFKLALEGKARQWFDGITVPVEFDALKKMFLRQFSMVGRSQKQLHEKWRTFSFDPAVDEVALNLAYLTIAFGNWNDSGHFLKTSTKVSKTPDLFVAKTTQQQPTTTPQTESNASTPTVTQNIFTPEKFIFTFAGFWMYQILVKSFFHPWKTTLVPFLIWVPLLFQKACELFSLIWTFSPWLRQKLKTLRQIPCLKNLLLSFFLLFIYLFFFTISDPEHNTTQLFVGLKITLHLMLCGRNGSAHLLTLVTRAIVVAEKVLVNIFPVFEIYDLFLTGICLHLRCCHDVNVFRIKNWPNTWVCWCKLQILVTTIFGRLTLKEVNPIFGSSHKSAGRKKILSNEQNLDFQNLDWDHKKKKRSNVDARNNNLMFAALLRVYSLASNQHLHWCLMFLSRRLKRAPQFTLRLANRTWLISTTSQTVCPDTAIWPNASDFARIHGVPLLCPLCSHLQFGGGFCRRCE